jgi:hypothetical protein
MTNRFDALTQQLFQKSIADCSVEELENLASEYPYFAPAQYILLSKLKGADYNGYQAQLQKAILYYHDPLAFDQFLNAGDYAIDFTSLEVPEALPVQNEIEESAEQEIKTEIREEDFPGIQEPELSDQIQQTEPPDEIKEPGKIFVENSPIEESIPEEIKDEEASKTAITKLIENIPPITAETTQTDAGLVFEPYHTVDYFASQGIKLSQEEVSKDKFGKQLKSFTEWLKTMKRLPAAEQVKSLEPVSEQKIENLAAHSVEGEEVYTETMAEVWVRQGNREKAMEVYNKLSLLNPSKRIYFAAKIDSLK